MIISKMFKLFLITIFINFFILTNSFASGDFNQWLKNFKIKAILKRNKLSTIIDNSETEFSFGFFQFNSKLRYLVFKNDKPIKLSPKENMLLKLLLLHKNDLMPRELALTRIWHDDNYFTSRSMDVYVTKIRKYLKKDPNISIENIHGKGFKMNV